MKDKNGNPINMTGIDDKLVSVLTQFSEGITAGINGQIGVVQKSVDTKFGELGGKIEALGKPAEPKPDDKTPDPKGGESELAKALAKITEKLDGLEGRINQDKERETVTALGEGWLKKNAPHMKPEQRSAVLARIVAAKPKDEDGVKQVIDQVKAEYAAIGGEAALKPFSTEPSKEGASEPSADEVKAKKDALLSQMTQDAKDKAG